MERKLINVDQLSYNQFVTIKTKIIVDGWSIDEICETFSINRDSFMKSYYEKFKHYLVTPVSLGNPSQYYDNENYHPWRKSDNMIMIIDHFKESKTIKEYVLEEKNKSNNNTSIV